MVRCVFLVSIESSEGCSWSVLDSEGSVLGQWWVVMRGILGEWRVLRGCF